MNISIAWLLGSFGGGALGAMMGPLPSIILWGLILTIAGVAGLITGDNTLVERIGFNPFFGAHIVYASGVGALAYAASRRYVQSGLDLVRPLIGLNKPDVLLVGGAFGVLGYLTERIATGINIPTDNVALSIFTTGLIARLMFDKGWNKNRFKDSEVKPNMWLNKHEFMMIVIMGFTISLVGAFGASIVKNPLIPFGLALVFIIFLQMGFRCEVWHHIVLVAMITSLHGGGSLTAMILGVILGTLAAVMSASLFKLWIDGTNSFIDPTVTSIGVCTSLMKLCAYTGLI